MTGEVTVQKSEILPIRGSSDVVMVRQRARAFALELGLSLVDQTKSVTAASELGRNTIEHGLGGTAELAVVERAGRRGLRMSFADRGPGIPDMELALRDGYTSKSGMGLGLSGSKRLMHEFDIVLRPRRGHHRHGDAMEMRRPTRLVTVTAGDDSQTGTARRQALSLAGDLDFDELHCGRLGIVVTELSRNLCLHGGGGELLLSPWCYKGERGIDILALDKGPGIADIGAAMADGYSTGGTSGTGLGAVHRLSETFQVFSQPGEGAAVFARMLSQDRPVPQPSEPTAAINLPVAGETVCGDLWESHHEAGRSLYMMADGLGHGPVAHEAAEEACRAFLANAHLPIGRILQAIHLALMKTRGAAVAIAEIPPRANTLNYIGAGNIASSIVLGGKTHSLVSMNGTPGLTIGNTQQFAYPWDPGALLIMHSDGLLTRWSLDRYRGLAARHPALIAGVLYRDFSRRRDDATVMVTGN